jgi:ATP-dependent RNA helicase DHX29
MIKARGSYNTKSCLLISLPFKVFAEAIPKTPKTPKTPRTPRTPSHYAQMHPVSRPAGNFLGPPSLSPSKDIPLATPASQHLSPISTPTKAPSRLRPTAPAFLPKAVIADSSSESNTPLITSASAALAPDEGLRPTSSLSDGRFSSSTTSLSSVSATESSKEDERRLMKARILASYQRNIQTDDNSTSVTPSSPVSPDDDDPHSEYVKVRLEIDDLTTHRRRADETRGNDWVNTLRAKLVQIKSHYFFDEREAEALYRVEREKADSTALQARLRGSEDSEVSAPTLQAQNLPPSGTAANDDVRTSLAKHRPPNLLPTSAVSKTVVPDVFEEESDEAGGLLDILEAPKPEITPAGTTMRVRDMTLPKQFSGRTPKILLAETVTKLDRYAAITYSCISGTSRACRASVSIRGDIVKGGDWSMQDIACHDQGQAEQYVAMIALHALSFPPTEGFAIGNTAPASAQTSFRVLPPIYRDLWDELEEDRKAQDDATNRAIWAKLRKIVEPKLDTGVKVKGYIRSLVLTLTCCLQHLDRTEKAEAASYLGNGRRMGGSISDLSPESIASGFQARQSSPAYQSMLASFMLSFTAVLATFLARLNATNYPLLTIGRR